MNQQCKVCGEPAAGFHFGAFTCEGCKSFFGRSYNNLSSISECKNNNECIINKKNRTSCKACRLRKCIFVGMSKSGSRYGRRSNWFKIHCLLQEQQQQSTQQRQIKTPPPPLGMLGQHPFHHQLSAVAAMSQHHHGIGRIPSKDEIMLFGLDDYKNSTSPSISSPESHHSDSSAEVNDSKHASRNNLFLNSKHVPEQDSNIPNGISKDIFVPLPFASLASLAPVFPHSAAAFLPTPAAFAAAQHHSLLFPPNSYLFHQQPKTQNNILKTNNNNRYAHNNNDPNSTDMFNKRYFLDAVLQSQRSPTNSGSLKEEPEEEEDELTEETEANMSSSPSPSLHHGLSVADQLRKMLPISKISSDMSLQDSPIDLSMKGCRIQNGRLDDERKSLSGRSNSEVFSDQEDFNQSKDSSREDDEDTDFENSNIVMRPVPHQEHRNTPIDLTTRA